MKTQRKPIPRISEKRSKSGKPFLKRSAIKRKHRKPSEFARVYGSKARVLFVKSLPCAACGVVGYSENAHVAPASEKGTGYKAGFEWIVPLCSARAADFGMYLYVGCHKLHDDWPTVFESSFPGFDPSTEASRVQKMWQEYQEAGK